MIKNYKESFLEVLGKFFVDFKDNELDEYCILMLKECLKYLNKELERLK